MTFYWWNHWFWITCCFMLLVEQQHQSAIYAMPASFSSLETISTSLKSALVQNDNSFQLTNDQQQKISTGSKSAPLTFETSDTDDLRVGASEIDVEKIVKTSEWLSEKHNTKNESSNTADYKPKFVSVKLEMNVNSPKPEDIIKSFTLSNVNSTNENISTTMPTTMLSSVTDSNAILSSIKTSTTQTTKLIRINEESTSSKDEHILTVKSLNLSASDVTEPSDLNDTVEIVMTDEESNATEIAELSERKSKGLLGGFSEETKIVNNISSRSTFQVTHLSQSSTNDEKLSSEALFDTDTDNGGITMNTGIISIICVGIIGSLSAFSILFVYVYRRRFLNKPQALSEPDSSGYIDDSTIRDNSDELYSLDNDSFLNSLEAMTIQNYWTDSVKHTKL
ncbi:unnamed protein product [Chironomus riparius]|uniref:Uncharacterized protein n=1 Tax=Chironomus riparius TaxID=315576 RepID=A0A9N9WMP8_9DIPT|nr:unnamed protein product [Chironomus riparius]